jgi:hypothetical protein
VIVTSSVEGVHVPFEIVHRKVFTPAFKPVTPEVGDKGFVIVAVPAITVHAPVPTTGVLDASVAIVSQIDWSVPAAEIVGKSSRSIVISSDEAVHVPLEIVHRNVFMPTLNPVTSEVGEEGVVTAPDPVITVHNPAPTPGVFPARVSDVAHAVSSGPAAAIVGTSSWIIVTSSVEGVHEPFEMLQRNVFIPMLNPVTAEVGDVGFVTVAVPAITDHAPVPTTGVFAESVAFESHTAWSAPAAEVVGVASRKIEMLSVDGVHIPFEIVHRNVFTPKLNPVTPEVGEVGVVTVPVPAITVHVLVPIAGVFPASVAVVLQTVWSAPAADVVGNPRKLIVMLSADAVHEPFVIVHRNVFTPTLNPVTPEVGEEGVVTVAPPAVTVHVPVPVTGVFAASVAVVIQTVWSGPAAETVGLV